MTLICESPSHKCIKINNKASDATDGPDKIEKRVWVSAEGSLRIPDSHICAIPFEIIVTDFNWDRDLYLNPDGIFYYVNHGADILVASAAIDILSYKWSHDASANMENGDA